MFSVLVPVESKETVEKRRGGDHGERARGAGIDPTTPLRQKQKARAKDASGTCSFSSGQREAAETRGEGETLHHKVRQPLRPSRPRRVSFPLSFLVGRGARHALNGGREGRDARPTDTQPQNHPPLARSVARLSSSPLGSPLPFSFRSLTFRLASFSDVRLPHSSLHFTGLKRNKRATQSIHQQDANFADSILRKVLRRYVRVQVREVSPASSVCWETT